MLSVEFQGETQHITMLQEWPIRQPRPSLQKLPPQQPLTCGLRVLNALFPCPLGGTGTIVGGVTWCKSAVLHSMCKYSNTDVMVHVICGEKSTDVAQTLLELPEISLVRQGQQESVMKKTCVIANAAGMSPAASDVSIFSAVTIGEYFRDMGYHVCVPTDSLTRWAQSLRDISARLSETPGEGGYPTYLSSRIASFFERAGRVTCLGSPNREGSITILGVVYPPGGDMSDHVTQSTVNLTPTMWQLDRQLAQQAHFPSVNHTESFSRNFPTEWYEGHVMSEYGTLRTKCLEILNCGEELKDTVRYTGKVQAKENKGQEFQ